MTQDAEHMTKELPFLVAEHCHGLLRNTLLRLRSEPSNQGGICTNLEILCRHLGKVRSFHGEMSLPKIGVYGPPKRGKSSLLNALLGVDILPTARSPKSSTVVEIHSASTNDPQPWLVEVTEDDGYTERHPLSSPPEVQNLIDQRGAHDPKAPNRVSAKRIKVIGHFNDSEVFSRKAVLLDTPGAEAAFDENETPSLAEDTKRAVEMLEETHIVLFVARADQMGADNEKAFFDKHMRMLRPLNVVNFLDKWDSDEENERLPCRDASNTYGFPLVRTIAVSAKWAKESLCSEDGLNADLWHNSGLSKLNERILEDLDELAPEKAVTMAIDELDRLVAQIRSNNSFQPDRVEFDNLMLLLETVHEEWAALITEKLLTFRAKWFYDSRE